MGDLVSQVDYDLETSPIGESLLWLMMYGSRFQMRLASYRASLLTSSDIRMPPDRIKGHAVRYSRSWLEYECRESCWNMSISIASLRICGSKLCEGPL